MDTPYLAPEEFERLAPERQRDEFARLPADRQSAVIEYLDPALRLTPDEQRRRNAAWSMADPTGWRMLAASCIRHVVESYGRGEFDMFDAVNAMHLAAIGCWAQDRVRLIGLMAEEARRRSPPKKGRGQRPPKWPLWVQNATADLVLDAQARDPQLRRTPLPAYSEPDIVKEPGDGTSEPITRAIEVLTSLGWFGKVGAPKPSTVDDWVRARLREATSVPPSQF
jgi:hypothetical protein